MASSGIADPGRADTEVDFTWGVEIPMADGTVLAATLYRPLDYKGKKLPTIVTITPYISDRYQPDAQYFARHGFAFLVVDTRGRGNSDGEFLPLSNQDGIDGAEVVQWIARQPWSNGKVGMRGGSYGGYNQWSTVRHAPKNLTTIAPVASPYHGIDFPVANNIGAPYIIQWITLTSGVTAQNRIFGDAKFWGKKYLAYHQNGVAFNELDALVGRPSEVFQQWLKYSSYDPYWEQFVPSPQELKKLALPILTITGYHDGDQPGAMKHYSQHMKYGSKRGKAQHYLILGPWDHSGTRLPRLEIGGHTFGDKALFDAFGLDKDWYLWTMSDGASPEFIKDKVTYFVAGANQWKSAPSLESISDRELVLTLGADVTEHNAYQTGVMNESTDVGGEFSRYVYDPLDTSKAERPLVADYLTDQSEVIQTDGDGLIFHSAPFEAATEISGYPRLEAWFEMNVADTDIAVSLYEVFEDGSSLALADDVVRARYRDKGASPQFMQPGKPTKFVFEDFYFFSRLVAQGSRLRLFVRPANGLQQQRNYNSATPVIAQTRKDAVTAVVKLHHSKDYPSRLILPLAKAQ